MCIFMFSDNVDTTERRVKRVYVLCGVDDANKEWDSAVRKTEGGRVRSKAVVSRFSGPGCGVLQRGADGKNPPVV